MQTHRFLYAFFASVISVLGHHQHLQCVAYHLLLQTIYAQLVSLEQNHSTLPPQREGPHTGHTRHSMELDREEGLLQEVTKEEDDAIGVSLESNQSSEYSTAEENTLS